MFATSLVGTMDPRIKSGADEWSESKPSDIIEPCHGPWLGAAGMVPEIVPLEA